MKLELVKETKAGREPWYVVNLDGEYKFGSWSHQDAMAAMNALLKDPTALDMKKEVLQAEEINVPSDSNQTNI